MWRTIYCTSLYNVHPVSPEAAYLLYFLMRRTKYRISSCGAYILHIFTISHYGIDSVPPHSSVLRDMAGNVLSLLTWCIIYIIFLQIFMVFPDTVYILYILVCRTCCMFWWGVQNIVSPDVWFILSVIYIVIPNMAYILYFLMWHTSYISWCSILYFVSPDVAHTLFLIRCTPCISWCDVFLVSAYVAYDILILLMGCISIIPDKTYILHLLLWHNSCISRGCVQNTASPDARAYCSSHIC